MKVGDLVNLIHSTSTTVGLITAIKQCRYTVYWANGFVNDTYEADELEVISESR